MHEWLSAQDVAERLDIDSSQVRRMAAAGRLPAQKLGHDWIFDAALISDVAQRKRVRGRPFSAESALGFLYELSGMKAVWLPPPRRVRLRKLRGSSLLRLLPRLRPRSDRRAYRAPVSAIRQLQSDPDFILSGVSASDHYGLRLLAKDILEGYIDKDRFDAIAHRYALEPASERSANLIIHLADGRLFPDERVMPVAVVAADLADSSDERSQQVGREVLQRLR
jgi:hypothetical protein